MYLVQRMLLCSSWWARRELNPRDTDFQSVALPAELPAHIKAQFVLQNVGLEPTTHCLSDNCSTKWANLATKLFAVRALWLREGGFEPPIFGLWGQRLNHLSTPQWYQRWESNSRPLPYEGSALTNWATRAYGGLTPQPQRYKKETHFQLASTPAALWCQQRHWTSNLLITEKLVPISAR